LKLKKTKERGIKKMKRVRKKKREEERDAGRNEAWNPRGR